MSVSKFVIKCGNFAVLVDLHVLPLGPERNANLLAEKYKEEVATMIRDAVDRRVKLFLEARGRKGPQKPLKELSPANPLTVKGEQIRLAAYFLKRHFTLRCVTNCKYGELRVFPERCVVCLTLPEQVKEPSGERELSQTQHAGQSKYFSIPCEGDELLSSSALVKRSTLQKMRTKQASCQEGETKGPGMSGVEDGQQASACSSEAVQIQTRMDGGLVGGEWGRHHSHSESASNGRPPASPSEPVMTDTAENSLSAENNSGQEKHGRLPVRPSPPKKREEAPTLPRKSRLRRVKKT